jgi:hypothetical protein
LFALHASCITHGPALSARLQVTARPTPGYLCVRCCPALIGCCFPRLLPHGPRQPW